MTARPTKNEMATDTKMAMMTLQGLVGVQQVAVAQLIVGQDHKEGEHERTAEELEDKRYRRRRRHSQAVEHVEDDDIGDHHGQKMVIT